MSYISPQSHLLNLLFWLQKKLQNSLFPSDFLKFVCEWLDPEDRIHQKDWTRVAEIGLGLTFAEIRRIRDLKESAGRSPTEYLLEQWVEKGKTLEQFETLMKDMGVRNVVLEMKKLNLNADSSSNPRTPRESPRPPGLLRVNMVSAGIRDSTA